MTQQQLREFLLIKSKEDAADILVRMVANGDITEESAKEYMAAWNFYHS